MYARVNRIEGRPERLDDAIAWWREHIAEAHNTRRAGAVLLIDRQTGAGIGIGLWNSREDMEGTEAGNKEDLREAQRVVGTEGVVIEHYEVADRRGAEKGTGAARLNWFEGSPGQTDTAIAWWRENIAELWRSQPGGQGAWLLLDRDSGRGISMTLWESDEARQATEDANTQTRSAAAQALDMRILGVERYEVAGWV
ncbi:MAG: antibiotic biosynthesis monooxygenase [Anaerolineae bacterium]